MNNSKDDIGLETVKALKEGSFEAFNSVYHTYFQRLSNYIYQLSKDVVLTQDIVQDTFLIVWNKRQAINENLALGSYIFTIARNEFLKNCRDKSKERAFLDEIKANAHLEVHSSGDKKELLKKVYQIIDEFSPKCKEAFVASKLHSLTYEEVAQRMGISKKTVEIHVSKAYSIIRQRIKIISLFLF